MGSDNERWRYIVISSLIGWANRIISDEKVLKKISRTESAKFDVTAYKKVMGMFSYMWDFCVWLFVKANSLWPSDAKRWHRIMSTRTKVIACFLTAPSYYLNQSLPINEISLWNDSFKISFKSSRDKRVKSVLTFVHIWCVCCFHYE